MRVRVCARVCVCVCVCDVVACSTCHLKGLHAQPNVHCLVFNFLMVAKHYFSHKAVSSKKSGHCPVYGGWWWSTLSVEYMGVSPNRNPRRLVLCRHYMR